MRTGGDLALNPGIAQQAQAKPAALFCYPAAHDAAPPPVEEASEDSEEGVVG